MGTPGTAGAPAEGAGETLAGVTAAPGVDLDAAAGMDAAHTNLTDDEFSPGRSATV
jgi:hypothetical protein